MAKFGESSDLVKCSFCGKSQKQVKKLIAGPGVYICDECIDLCNEIIDEELTTPSTLDLDNLPRPMEIYESLNDYVVSQEEAKRTLSVIGSLRRGTPGRLYLGLRASYRVPFEVWAQDDRTRRPEGKP